MNTPLGLLLSDDLIFASRITGTARHLGLRVDQVRSPAVLREYCYKQPPRCIIVDLANTGLDIDDLIGWLRGHCTPVPRVVAYGSHVDAATLDRARQAGCDPVWPRSKFVAELAQALPGWFAAPEPQP
jgi:CheY-like chemotaxis protein